jgi:hypothetical protein
MVVLEGFAARGERLEKSNIASVSAAARAAANELCTLFHHLDRWRRMPQRSGGERAGAREDGVG